MGLYAWYPLNGTGESKGLVPNAFSISDSEYEDGGKFGKSYATKNKRKSTGAISGIENLKQVSVAFWMKENAIDTVAWQDFVMFYVHYDDGEKVTNGECRLEQHTTSDKTKVYMDWYCSVTSTSYPTSTGAAIYTNNPQATNLDWHHIVFMLDFKNHKCITYVDGTLNKTSNINTNALYITGALYIGDSNIDGNVCDLRVYDHLLSKEEISNLNKALILHYPLNNGSGNENLVEDSLNFTKNWSIASDWTKHIGEDGITYITSTRTGSTANTWSRAIPAYKIIPADFPDGITVSFDFKCDDYSLLTQKCICSLQTYNESNTRVGWVEPTSDLKTSYINGENIQDGVWVRIGRRFSATDLVKISQSGYTSDDVAYTKISFQLVRDGTISIKRVKLEKGNKMSSWCPNVTELGSTANIEFDESGNGYNGEKSTGVLPQVDSPIGVGSYNLTKKGYIHKIPAMLTSENKNFSISTWVKFDNTSSTMCIYNNRTTVGSGIAIFYVGGRIRFDDGNDSGGTSHQWTPNKTFTANTWYHICVTRSASKKKLYVNGEFIEESSNVGGLLDLGTQYASIGASSTNGAAGNSNMFLGNMTDFRIYGSELSVSDVKGLYKTKAKIDKNGNLYCNEFIEDDYDEELLTSQSLSLSQATSGEASIERETIGGEVINKIIFGDAFTSWKYLSNNTFPKDKILNKNLLLTFKYKVDSVINGTVGVRFCSGSAQAPQPISVGTFIPTTEWQEYVGIIEMGAEYASQVVYIRPVDSLKLNTLYIKDLSLKLVGNKYNISLSKKSIMNSKMIEEVSDDTSVKKNKNGVIIAKEVIEM